MSTAAVRAAFKCWPPDDPHSATPLERAQRYLETQRVLVSAGGRVSDLDAFGQGALEDAWRSATLDGFLLAVDALQREVPTAVARARLGLPRLAKLVTHAVGDFVDAPRKCAWGIERSTPQDKLGALVVALHHDSVAQVFDERWGALLDAVQDLDAADEEIGITPLIAAISGAKPAIALRLLERGASPDAVSKAIAYRASNSSPIKSKIAKKTSARALAAQLDHDMLASHPDRASCVALVARLGAAAPAEPSPPRSRSSGTDADHAAVIAAIEALTPPEIRAEVTARLSAASRTGGELGFFTVCIRALAEHATSLANALPDGWLRRLVLATARGESLMVDGGAAQRRLADMSAELQAVDDSIVIDPQDYCEATRKALRSSDTALVRNGDELLHLERVNKKSSRARVCVGTATEHRVLVRASPSGLPRRSGAARSLAWVRAGRRPPAPSRLAGFAPSRCSRGALLG